MTLFADSSAIVKRYADEAGHAVIRSISEPLVVSTLARVEVHAALWRKARLGDIEDSDVSILGNEFESDWWGSDDRAAAFTIIAVNDVVLDGAIVQVARHGLRAYDAMQLASAVSARGVEASIDSFACFDVELRRAAVREGFALVPAD